MHLLDFGIASGDNAPYLIMEYASQGTLRIHHPRGSIVPLGTVVSYVRQIASALQYAHDRNLIHRDLKPENLLVGDNGEILLSDFGIAALAQSTLSMQISGYAGTIPYSAPEQILGKPRPASDQYALGIILYEWLTGDRPFHGSFTEISTQHLFAPPPPLHEKVPGTPPAVEAVIMKALTKDPHQRFERIQAFATAFERACMPPSLETLSATSHTSGETTRTRESVRTEEEVSSRRNLWQWYKSKGIFTKLGLGFGSLFIVLMLCVCSLAAYGSTLTPQDTVQPTPITISPTGQTAAAQAAQTASVIAQNTDPYPPHNGSLVLYDPLSQPNRWTNGSGGSAGNCQFSNSALIDTASQSGETFSCVDNGDDFANFAFEVRMKILKGDCGGIDFQLVGKASYNYVVCRDGEYDVSLYQSNGQSSVVIDHYSSVIHTGLGSDNTIAITVIGNKLDLYVNGAKIDTTSNIQITHGEVGVLAGTHANTQESVVAYKEAKVWKLP